MATLQDGSLEYAKGKVKTILNMCKYFGLYEHNILVASNAINDVGMLNLEAKHRVLVGPEGNGRDTILGCLYGHDYVTFVDTPEDLGRFLQSI